MRNVMRVGLVLAVALQAVACKIEVDDDLGVGKLDPDEIEDKVRDVADDLANVEVCPGQTLKDLFEADAISDSCRDKLLSFLPEPETTFEARLIAPGGVWEADGDYRFLLQGADADGAALTADALAELEVYVTVDGQERLLLDGELEVSLGGDLSDDLIALSVVNDYSASMTDRDLRDVADVEEELFACLPPVYESEVVRFSDTVEVQETFTSDADALLAAVAFDDAFARSSTALIDGLGTAGDDLAGQERPVKLVVLSTDGRENASMQYMQDEVLEALDDQHVFLVVMGALLADVDFIRELTDGRGVFFYTREFSALQDAVSPYLESVKQLVEVRVSGLDAPPSRMRVEAAGLKLDLAVP